MQIKKRITGVATTIKEITWLLVIVFLIRTFGFGLYQVPTGSMETTMLVGERFFADKFTLLFSKPTRGSIIAFNDPRFAYSSNFLIRLYQEYIGWPCGPANWTKRIIGVPGDHIQGKIEGGKPVVYLNDKKLDEPYINHYPLLAVLNASHRAIDWRSYDKTKSYEQQPFYHIDSSSIVDLSMISNQEMQNMLSNHVKISAGTMLLKEFGQPIQDESYAKQLQGRSYWTNTDVFDVYLGPTQYWCMGDNRRGSYDCRYFGPIESRLIHGKILFRIWSSDSPESWWIIDLLKHPIDFWKRIRWHRFFQCIQ